jgi:hypothetical protein
MKKVALLFAFISLVACASSNAQYYTFTSEDTVYLSWDATTDVVRYYTVTLTDSLDFTKTYSSTFYSWDTDTDSFSHKVDIEMPVGHYVLTMVASNNAGTSAPSDPIYVWFHDPIPGKVSGVRLIIKRIQ